MMSYDVGQAKKSGWMDKFAKLDGVLNECSALACEIVGSVPSNETGAKEGSCLADKVTGNLVLMIERAEYLRDQLRRIQGEF